MTGLGPSTDVQCAWPSRTSLMFVDHVLIQQELTISNVPSRVDSTRLCRTLAPAFTWLKRSVEMVFAVRGDSSADPKVS